LAEVLQRPGKGGLWKKKDEEGRGEYTLSSALPGETALANPFWGEGAGFDPARWLSGSLKKVPDGVEKAKAKKKAKMIGRAR
jgi:hypothetical protein